MSGLFHLTQSVQGSSVPWRVPGFTLKNGENGKLHVRHVLPGVEGRQKGMSRWNTGDVAESETILYGIAMVALKRKKQ